MKESGLLLCLVLMILLPAILSAGTPRKHPSVPEDLPCSECHAPQTQEWQSGKHGLVNVGCVVCHGAADRTFDARPDIYRCRGCHGSQVVDVEKNFPAGKRDCSLCHDRHSTSTRFHKERGK